MTPHPDRLAVALFNDTGNQPHVGCLAVSQAHRLMLRRAGGVVRHAFFQSDWHHLSHASLADGIRAALASAPLRRVFAEVDAVVVNGEGTIHHRQGRHLLAILGAAQQLGVPTFLVNAVLQDVDDAVEVLGRLTDCTVRDACSARYLDGLQVPRRLVPDSFFEARFLDQPCHDFDGALVVTDCHPSRTAEFRPELDRLRETWSGRVAAYPLEDPGRAGDWQHALADFRAADVIVTGRHHGACLALRAGVPFVMLPSNTWKIEGLQHLLEGYPAAAADATRSMSERVAAARAARSWFTEASTQWAARLPLSTLDRLQSSTQPSRPIIRAAAATRPQTLRAVTSCARPGSGILHCGSGTGLLVAALCARGSDAHGVDVAAVLADGQGVQAPGRFRRGTPETLPFGDGEFGMVIVAPEWLEHLEETELDGAIREIVRVAADGVIIETSGSPSRGARAAGTSRTREWWESRVFRAGLRRHTQFFSAVAFEALEHESEPCLVMQKIPAAALQAHPLASRAPERYLHQDMLRATGRLADAHLARYEWARSWIKPGDVVVDAACGRGYGTAMLWDGSEAASVVGVDLSESAVGYARDNFCPGRPGIEYRTADAEAWDGWADNSVDCIISFETLEHLPDPARFVEGAFRVLKPGGRLLCSVPNEWRDEAGRDPNPFHLHVFNLHRLASVIGGPLLVDEAYAQSAGGHAARFAPVRLLQNAGWPEPDPELMRTAEWWLLSAVKDPLAGAAVPYTEQVFPAETAAVPNVIAFQRDYLNPWAVHALVMAPFRVRSRHLLRELAARWLATSPKDSADAGAALCLLAYSHLDEPAGDVITALLPGIAAYCAGRVGNVQGERWQVSLRFVEGLLRMRRGEFAAAEASFRDCAARDATAFTPHLETKTTEAAWLAGRLALERGDAAAAAAAWASAFAALDRIKAAPLSEWLVTPGRPAAFELGDGLREIAVAIDNATLSANALRRLTDTAGGWRHGPRPVERNFQRTIDRLSGDVRAAWHSAEDAWVQVQGANQGWQQALDQIQTLRLSSTARPPTIADGTAPVVVFRDPSALRLGVFGTGAGAATVSEALSGIDSARIVWFADNDPRRQGGTLRWLEVISPAEIPARPFDAVVIGSMNVTPIRDQLIALGVSAERILAPDVTAGVPEVRLQLRRALALVAQPAG